MPYAKTDDRVKIYYEAHGRGFPLALAYGIGGNTTMWEPNVRALSARYRLILWDPRGHGRSDSPEDPTRYSFRRWALDLRDLLDHLRIRKAYVGGLSMGGGIAIRFTLLYPKRVAALIVTNSASAAGLPLSVENLVMRARSIEITLTKGMDAMA
ncbi:MAG: alpha/beta fold hydrolase, partial [Candidatus Rokubacteria bacterium]|nr:alpha/beta fold hydrolase [Candidatus Rokubacteria bacterium]